MNILQLKEDDTPNEMSVEQARQFIAANRGKLRADAERMAMRYEKSVADSEALALNEAKPPRSTKSGQLQ